MSKLKVILSGQKSFGKAVYQLVKKMKDIGILAVYAPAGDKLYEYAEIFHEDVRVSGTLRSFSMPQNADLIIAAHSHDFISSNVRNRLRLGAIGYHPSLLPRHRGRDAVEWTIRMKDPIAGGSVFWLNDTVDGGPIARQGWCWVRSDDTASELWRRELFPMGLRLIRETLEEIMTGTLRMVDQDIEIATWEPSLDGAPRLFRPELMQIGYMIKNNMKVVKDNLKQTEIAFRQEDDCKFSSLET